MKRLPYVPLAIAALLAALSGCVPFRETRQQAAASAVLDAATLRPIPRAVAVIRADRGKKRVVEHRRYAAGADGRIAAPEVRGWTFVMGLPLPADHVSVWENEHLYLAPGHAWLIVPLGKDLEGRAPDRVILNPLPAGAPQIDLSAAGGRSWSGLETWQISVPACEGYAQGLREGDGRVIYWDPRRIVMAAAVEVAEEGLRFDDSPRRPGIQVITSPRATEARRALLDTHSCSLNIQK